ncbi:MAG TPA: glycosyltransferase family A protein [Myxococcaceae bacterium]|nr:glycosyltransferase family A protein [Myxococcaceae bacterium]
MNAVVITPTTGAPELLQCARSVQAQTYRRLRHLVVVDGPQFAARARRVLRAVRGRRVPLDVLQLPRNTGGRLYMGHRIYAASPHLVDEDLVLFLDEDNWYEPDHVAALVSAVRRGRLDWAYSLRKVVDRGGALIARDDCESLGRWPIWNSPRGAPRYLVDTSCFAVRREVLIGISFVWHQPRGADRVVTELLRDQHPRHGCSGRYSLNYRLGSGPDSPVAEFFLAGNAAMARRHPRGFPWAR